MAQTLYPDSLLAGGSQSFATLSYTSVGIWQDLNSDASSFVEGAGGAVFSVGLADPAMADDQLCSVTVQFDARPVAGLESSWIAPLIAEMYDTATGAVYARSSFNYAGQSGFAVSTVVFGSIITRAQVNRCGIRVYTASAPSIQRWQMNDLHGIVTALFDGPTATVTGPNGALADNTPTIQFTAAVDDSSTETLAYAVVRIFNDDQYLAGGFNPDSSPAFWDSGKRLAPSFAITSIVLPPDNYRAYVAAVQAVSPGLPWTGGSSGTLGAASLDAPNPFATPQVVYQTGHFVSFASFSIVTAAPAAVGPTIRVDAVRDLTEDQRQRITEPFQPLPRVSLFSPDGAYVRDLDILSGSVTLDAAALIRGTASFTCSDIDIVPTGSSEASGEHLALNPFGSYVHICYGFQFDRFTQVFVGVGVFRISTVQTDRKSGVATVKAKDFSLDLQDARFGQATSRQNWDTVPPTPFTVLATAQQIITEAGLAYRTPTTSAAQVITNYINKRGADRTKELQGLANSIDGWTHYADIDGVIYFGPGPDIETDAIVYTFNDADPSVGRLTAQIIDRDEELSRDNVYDVVVVTDPAELAIGGAYDASPGSVIARSAATPGALYIGAGPFSPGGKPYFFTSPIATTNPAAEAAARTLFPNVALPADTITAQCAPIPDMRPDKMVAMPRAVNGTIEKWQVTKVQLPLTIGPVMTWDGVTLPNPTTPAS